MWKCCRVPLSWLCCTICTVQAAAYKEDFLQERKDKEAFHDEHRSFREVSAIKINRLQFELNETKKKLVATDSHKEIEQLQEEIVAYKKQLDACKEELDEERRRGQVMQDRIEVLDALQEQKIADQV